MAAVKGTYNTDYTSNPRKLPASNIWGGNVKVAYDEYEASALDAASTISGPVVPKGARIWDIHVLADDLGTSTGTIAVGDQDSADRYIAAYAAGSATFKSLLKDGKIAAVGYETTEETTITLTTATAAISGTIKILVFYTYE